jgi:hypothetical protein
VVGKCFTVGTFNTGAFRWTAAGGLEVLDDLPDAQADSVSDDGNVIAGAFVEDGAFYAFRWTRQTGMVELGISGGGVVSADGSVVAVNGTRWTASGTQSITPLQNVYDISGDGKVIVGTGLGDNKAYQWMSGSGSTELLPPSGTTGAAPTSVNTDGSVIVGYAFVGTTRHAVIWKGSQRTDIGEHSGGFTAVSGNGTKAVATNPPSIWDQTNGMRELAGVLNAIGGAVPQSALYDVFGISRDGRYVVGSIRAGERRRAFRARLP